MFLQTPLETVLMLLLIIVVTVLAIIPLPRL